VEIMSENKIIVQTIQQQIEESGIKYTFIAEKTKIEYQRLMRIFNHGAIISGHEMIKLCMLLKMEPERFYNSFTISDGDQDKSKRNPSQIQQ
jgi:uncharacterized protein YqgV (UPF0045/DUF77 family)